MGSLFDGIGGFPLAAIRNGILPVWASEIEAFPIAVTRLRFPDMLHVGDITKLNRAGLPPVDIICGGSLCQDLSVAGARDGLAGSRSSLFMEQTRITREMRDAEQVRGRTGIHVRPDFYCGKVIPVGQTRSVFQFAPKASHARKQTQLFPGVINCSGLSAQEQFTDTLHKPGNEVRIDLVIHINAAPF